MYIKSVAKLQVALVAVGYTAEAIGRLDGQTAYLMWHGLYDQMILLVGARGDAVAFISSALSAYNDKNGEFLMHEDVIRELHQE